MRPVGSASRPSPSTRRVGAGVGRGGGGEGPAPPRHLPLDVAAGLPPRAAACGCRRCLALQQRAPAPSPAPPPCAAPCAAVVGRLAGGFGDQEWSMLLQRSRLHRTLAECRLQWSNSLAPSLRRAAPPPRPRRTRTSQRGKAGPCAAACAVVPCAATKLRPPPLPPPLSLQPGPVECGGG
jgi:hypothetical protein